MPIDGKTCIFLDESGKPEVFSAKGVNLVNAGYATKFLILAAIRTSDQLLLQEKIVEFKLGLLRDPSLTKIFSPAYSLDAFHANKDYEEVKNKFYTFINELDVKINVIVVEKLKCYSPLLQSPGRLYGVMAGQLLKDLCHQTEYTEIIFSRKDSKLMLRQELETEVERQRLDYLSQHPDLNNQVNLNYYHNPHYTHGGLQVADYVTYALFRFFEKKDDSYYRIISSKIGKVHDICNKKYFTKSNPLQLST